MSVNATVIPVKSLPNASISNAVAATPVKPEPLPWNEPENDPPALTVVNVAPDALTTLPDPVEPTDVIADVPLPTRNSPEVSVLAPVPP